MKTLLSLSLTFSLVASASIQLPLHTLRDQSQTSHCWAYASSHFLESRALVREGLGFMFDTERYTKYWVDYERMLALYRTKEDIYLSESEGGWQIEFWDSLLKHGKSFYSTQNTTPQILYPVLQDYFEHLAFIVGPAHQKPSNLPSYSSVSATLKGSSLKNDDEAKAYIIDHLNKRYGTVNTETTWFGSTIPLKESARKIMGKEAAQYSTTEDMVLIKPVSDSDQKWVKYLGERFWGYRFPKSKVLGLIKDSLDKSFPVTFDNVGHAMTIIAYETKGSENYFAVADSWHGKITWYASSTMLSNLNLVTFFRETVESALPPKPEFYPHPKIDYDLLDNLKTPPL